MTYALAKTLNPLETLLPRCPSLGLTWVITWGPATVTYPDRRFASTVTSTSTLKTTRAYTAPFAISPGKKWKDWIYGAFENLHPSGEYLFSHPVAVFPSYFFVLVACYNDTWWRDLEIQPLHTFSHFCRSFLHEVLLRLEVLSIRLGSPPPDAQTETRSHPSSMLQLQHQGTLLWVLVPLRMVSRRQNFQLLYGNWTFLL